tara:strand:+ start:413 stop:688 length:276 start_codon:yes stop_codon:yes gene_type:complete
MIFNLDINIDFNAVDGKSKYKATEIQNIIAEYIEAKSVYRILDLNGSNITVNSNSNILKDSNGNKVGTVKARVKFGQMDTFNNIIDFEKRG